MRKSFIVILLVLILSTVWIVFRMYNKPHRNPLSETSIQISATELFHRFENNEAEANGLYLDKVLEISGTVSEITSNQELIPIIVLETDNPMFAVRCTMENPKATATVGETVIIKGICTGYLSDVIIVNGVLVDKKL